MTPSIGYPRSPDIKPSNFVRQALQVLIVPLLLVPCMAAASGREKSDVVYMKNGDKITCEIRSLEKGQLTVKPDYTNSNIALDWEKVDHIESKQDFVVTDPEGKVYTGTVEQDSETKSLEISGSNTTKLPNLSVIQIEELGESFWKRMRGNVDFGTSFARSNDQKNISLQGGLHYQSREHLFSLDSNSQFTSQQKTDDTNETNVKTALYHSLRRSNWYYGGIANFLSSTAQQIDLRSTLGGGLAKRMIFTNRTNLNAIGGLALTVEKDAPTRQAELARRRWILLSLFNIRHFDSIRPPLTPRFGSTQVSHHPAVYV